MNRISEEQIDRLMLIMQKSLNNETKLKQGEANNNATTGITITQPWEWGYTDNTGI